MVNRSYGKLAHAKGTQFERSMFHAERSILNSSTFALPRSRAEHGAYAMALDIASAELADRRLPFGRAHYHFDATIGALFLD